MTPGDDPDRLPEFDPARFDDEEADRRLADLEILDEVAASSGLTEDDVEALDSILKEGLREGHVESRTGDEKRGLEEI